MSETPGILPTLSLSSLFLIDEKLAVDNCLARLDWSDARHFSAAARARHLVEAVRKAKSKPGAIQSFLREFSLDTEEGLALMTLAEALLRVPDAYTADLLIADKVTDAHWSGPSTVDDWLVRAAGAGMALSRKTLESVVSRLGAPVIRQALRRAVQFMGAQFVLGETITDAFNAAKAFEKRGYRMSYDMLGEGARTHEDAERYFASYNRLLAEMAAAYPAGSGGLRPTVSVKLSALHPRYEYAQGDRCVPVIVERVLHLARQAASLDIAMTIDAEEASRLETSLDIIRQVHADAGLGAWEGLGLAIQAYDKRALAVVEEAASWVAEHRRRLTPRLVKGAYWDSEIKIAQVNGLQDFPVYTRKTNTDVSYLACAKRMLELRDSFHCLFGTHNAYTVAAIIDLAQGNLNRLEFQRLQGMGEALHDHIIAEHHIPVSIYAPVGPYHELLPYLVRRMLENGANSSFVNQLYDPDIPVDSVVKNPAAEALTRPSRRHASLPLPTALYGPGRRNSGGIALYAPTHLRGLQTRIAHWNQGHKPVAMPILDGEDIPTSQRRAVINPADLSQVVGEVSEAGPHLVEQAMQSLHHAFPGWNATHVKDRAAILRRCADLLERDRESLMVTLGLEGGRTLSDSLSEVREAVDFCRYYAEQAEHLFVPEGTALPGPTGESNRMRLLGRGVFVCISPWNFPLAIFLGQVVAALAAGNTVLAKPAEQTPLIAHAAIRLLLEAGLPPSAIALMPGDGQVGAAAVSHPLVGGVCFTGSTEVARRINLTLAQKDGPIVPLIAETGGLNAMVVDSSALPEQVVDAAILSAFGSAGQRCSALRLLLVQDEIAPKIIALLRGAMETIRLGAPLDLSTDVGPVIDAEARARLEEHIAILGSDYQILARAPLPPELAAKGHFVAPTLAALPEADTLQQEVFGPILHVVRYKARELDDVIAAVNSLGYGLTFGLQTRINGEVAAVCDKICAGNIYINRSIIGAVVGVQPFGGMGLSGTGPKAGGPHYLPRFAAEQTITINTAATGGNLDLLKSPD